MSNLDEHPDQVVCAAEASRAPEVLAPREVPQGGPRAMTVRRTLPSRRRSLIGAWCFIDHYGPDVVAETGGMVVAPHPHTGLQTVSWLFSGEVEHSDSAGHRAIVRPGELNLMTAGRGISHSEISTAATSRLHGVQLWVALPDGARSGDPGFEHYAPEPVSFPGGRARVFLGSLLGSTSPVGTATPLLGAELVLDPGASATIEIDPAFEVGVLVDQGAVEVADVAAASGDLVYLPPGTNRMTLTAGSESVRALVLGGPPFPEAIVMWWNFVGRSHEEIVAFREDWQRQVARGVLVDGPFGIPVGDQLPPLPAPTLPNARLRERR